MNTQKKSQYWFQSLSVKLYGGLALFIGLILILSVFSWSSLREVVNIQTVLIDKSMPKLKALSSIVKSSEKLITGALQLTASLSQEGLNKVTEEIQADIEELKKALNYFEQSKESEDKIHFIEVRKLALQMTENLKKIEHSVSEKRKWISLIQQSLDRITVLGRRLHKTLVIEIDDQTFDFAVQSKAVIFAQKKNIKRIRLKDILVYRRLLDLQAQISRAVSLLRETEELGDTDLIQPVRERFLAAISAGQAGLKIFPNTYKELRQDVNQLKQEGLDERQGVFQLKQKILNIEKQQNQYLKENKTIAGRLAEKVRTARFDIQDKNRTANKVFERSMKKAQAVLFSINIFSLLGALALALFFVWPLAKRLAYLSRRMIKMADGDLKEPVQLKGSDEIRDMAGALELFRQNTLEAQRLNLVEKLSKELKKKNKDLEKSIADLHKTKKQLVLQEKLASLGQLTAGIAHEIKNPLNFINNFSKISHGLLKDLKEDLAPAVREIGDKKYEEIQESLQDLQSNMKKISAHGERADNIVNGMLDHSRSESLKRELVDINKYMDTYSELALHSKRSLNSSFTVSLEKNYDPNMPAIEIVPQDMSRMILNIISNACDAVYEKQNQNDEVYRPCIELCTKKEGKSAKIFIKDNGLGLPNEIKEKIFNPFFTTKATGQGTGLGLSLTQDIAVKYGGSITVNSKEGEFTEFVISLPYKQ